MHRHAKSGPDPSQPVLSNENEIHGQVEDASFDTDFANLAARFGAQSGGTLSLELCADLALEIVLNEIVERACQDTGASGAAIVLQRDGEMVCRASSGATAPELGARLDSASGISGECFRTRQTQRCDDVLLDPRVDLQASERLGVRSVIVMPLFRGDEMVGVIELFSFGPNAFEERDERTLEALAERIVRNLERATQQLQQLGLKSQQGEDNRSETKHPENKPPEPPYGLSPAAKMVGSVSVTDLENSSWRRLDPVTWTFATAVVACAIWLGVLLDRPLALQRVIVRTYPKAVSAAPATLSGSTLPNPSPLPQDQDKDKGVDLSTPRPDTKPAAESAVPPGSLQVFENGKEVFRMPPAQGQVSPKRAEPSSAKPENAAEVASLKTDGILLHRVEPEYPELARQQKVQGVVVLEVHVSADGAVQEVQTLSGPPLLIKASTDAVKQWRFKPHIIDGRAVEMQSRVSLSFRLPN